MHVWLIGLVVLLCPGFAAAGAWPRDKGSIFLSFGYTASSPIAAPGDDLQGYSSVYLERGLNRDLTLGFDAGTKSNTDYSAIVFIRRPVGPGGGSNVFAVQAGVGVAALTGSTDYLMQIGASWGRGLTTRFGSGWASLDGAVQYRLNTQEVVTKADLTLGLKPAKRTKIIVQMQIGDYPDSDPYVRIAPSVVREIRPGRHVELGAQIGMVGEARFGVTFGTWLEF